MLLILCNAHTPSFVSIFHFFFFSFFLFNCWKRAVARGDQPNLAHALYPVPGCGSPICSMTILFDAPLVQSTALNYLPLELVDSGSYAKMPAYRDTATKDDGAGPAVLHTVKEHFGTLPLPQCVCVCVCVH